MSLILNTTRLPLVPREIGQRIYGNIVYSHLEMEMISRRLTRRSDVRNDLTLRYIFAHANVKRAAMPVDGL